MLHAQYIDAIVREFREGYQIPPYFTDEAIISIAKEAYAYLEAINPRINISTDLVARNLMKNRMFYSYNHRELSFAEDYNSDLTTWQLNSIGG